MGRFMNQRKEQIGQAPGSFIFTGDIKSDEVSISVMDFTLQELEEHQLSSIEEVIRYKETSSISWININGLHDVALMRRAGEIFNIPNLIMEDILHTGQRPKIEEFDGGLFISLKMLRLVGEEEEAKVVQEQLSLLLFKHVVLTFQEESGDVFRPVRERIRQGRRRMRESGPDYLSYALLDVIMDSYGYITGRIGEYIEALDAQVMDNPGPEVLDEISTYKREIIFLRRVIRPARDIISQLHKIEQELVKPEIRPFFGDLSDHAVHVSEVTDSYREMLSDQLGIYHTVVSTRMNDIMKVLTIFAAIFIPLTFIAGIYGTNFQYVPELNMKYGYFGMWGVMIIVAISMLAYFRRKGWL